MSLYHPALAPPHTDFLLHCLHDFFSPFKQGTCELSLFCPSQASLCPCYALGITSVQAEPSAGEEIGSPQQHNCEPHSLLMAPASPAFLPLACGAAAVRAWSPATFQGPESTLTTSHGPGLGPWAMNCSCAAWREQGPPCLHLPVLTSILALDGRP